MSEANIRRLRRAPGFESLDVPAGFQQGVGNRIVKDGRATRLVRDADKTEVERHGNQLIARFEQAQKSAAELAAKAKGGKKKSGGRPILEEDIAKPFNELVEYIQTVAINARNTSDGSPTVVADAAAALMSLDNATRDMVLRRAGYPEVFEPLRNSELPEPPADGSMARVLGREDGRAKVMAEEADIAAAESVDNLPLIKRWSSVFAEPDKLDSKGKIVKSSQRYKETEPRDFSPLDVVGQQEQAARIKKLGYTDEEIAAMPQSRRDEIVAVAAPTRQGYARGVLAGDQIAQVKKIEQKFGEGSAKVPETVRNKDFPQSREVTLTVGTDPNYWRARDRQRATAGRSGATTGKVIDQRNRGTFQKVLETMYSLTEPKPARDVGTGEIKLKQRVGKKQVAPAQIAEPVDTTINLDQYFPWWRGRFAVADESGKLRYPNRRPSAEFVTGLIEGAYGAKDPEFFQRMLPLIQRSIDAAPEAPSTQRALQMSERVFLPSEQFQQAMQGGVGSRDYPYEIYGPQKAGLSRVKAPERSPFDKPELKQSPKAESAIDEYRRLMGEPGLGDQSSIYKMPTNSPMRMLLA